MNKIKIHTKPNDLTAKIKPFIRNVNLFMSKEKEFIKRDSNKNKLDFKTTLYASALILNSSGIDNVACDLKINNIVIVSKNSLIKKRNNDTTYACFKNINDKIIDMIYDNNNNFIDPYNFNIGHNNTFYTKSYGKKDNKLFINRTKKRFIGCDGTQINLNKKLINGNDIKASSSGDYGVCIISSIYDVMNGIPINYNITKCNNNNIDKKKVNETNGLLSQLSYLSNNDIIIFDRWYYSENLVKILNNNDIGYIFRMKKNSNFFKGMCNGKSKNIDYMGREVQLFKYKIKDKQYCILSSITEKISINEVKSLYQKRWKIETDNRKIKYDILYNNIRSKNYNTYLTDLETVRFVSIISSYIEYIGNKTPNKKINSKNCINIIYKKLLHMIFYESNNKESMSAIYNIIGIIHTVITYIINNRAYERKSIMPHCFAKNGLKIAASVKKIHKMHGMTISYLCSLTFHQMTNENKKYADNLFINYGI